jgi:hypothetical protein
MHLVLPGVVVNSATPPVQKLGLVATVSHVISLLKYKYNPIITDEHSNTPQETKNNNNIIIPVELDFCWYIIYIYIYYFFYFL